MLRPLVGLIGLATVIVLTGVGTGYDRSDTGSPVGSVGEAPEADTCSPATKPADPTLQTIRFDWSQVRVESDLLHAEARDHILAKEAGDPTYRAIRQKAAAMLRDRGLRPTAYARAVKIYFPKEAPRERFASLNKIRSMLLPTLNAEEWEGFEIIAESWDDGQDGTWEGNVYVRELSTGNWQSANEQKQLGTEPYYAEWSDPVGSDQNPQQRCRKTGSACGYCGSSGVSRCNLQRALDDRWPIALAGRLRVPL